MNIIINTSSMTPIYEQIVEIIKKSIVSAELLPGEGLPSVRALSGELKISALTVKKAYDKLEEEGFTETVHGKGTYVRTADPALIREQQLRELEEDIAATVEKARRYGITEDELREIFDIVTEV